MRATLDLDDDILHAAQELAVMRKTTPGKILSELARQSLFPANDQDLVRNGVPLLPKHPDQQPVTLEMVNDLRDQE